MPGRTEDIKGSKQDSYNTAIAENQMGKRGRDRKAETTEIYKDSESLLRIEAKKE